VSRNDRSGVYGTNPADHPQHEVKADGHKTDKREPMSRQELLALIERYAETPPEELDDLETSRSDTLFEQIAAELRIWERHLK
jgi:hypothetical protein